ncbi:hypothetical protein JW711_01985 [Candidatus Woesearchaeota archaeon]|nr:hypothetical protein [Candidatus Woesearchaeota archaeon]
MSIKRALALGGISLASLLVNPNYESIDFQQPQRYIQKMGCHKGYEKSGIVYGLSAAVLAGAAVGGLKSAYRKNKRDA